VFDVTVEPAMSGDEEYNAGGAFCNAAGSGVEFNAVALEWPAKPEGQSFRSRNSGANLGFRVLFISWSPFSRYREIRRTTRIYNPDNAEYLSHKIRILVLARWKIPVFRERPCV
jgi:hypothetical protein